MTTTSSTTAGARAVAGTNGAGTATWAMGALFERLVGVGDTGGLLAASVVTQPPDTGSPLHVHTREAEAWYLLEGTMTYVAGGQTFHLSPGDFIYLPQGVPHAFRTTGTAPVRFLGLALPGAVLDLYDEVGEPATERRLPDGGVTPGDVARWMELAPKYGLRVVGAPIAAGS
jgi:mannose-6-phosphate isomerase-like protein (cupin superfamily)